MLTNACYGAGGRIVDGCGAMRENAEIVAAGHAAAVGDVAGARVELDSVDTLNRACETVHHSAVADIDADAIACGVVTEAPGSTFTVMPLCVPVP